MKLFDKIAYLSSNISSTERSQDMFNKGIDYYKQVIDRMIWNDKEGYKKY